MKKKLLRKYIRNYLGVLVVLLVLLSPIYMAVYQGTKELIVKDAYNKLEQGTIDLDNRISKMQMVKKLMCDYRNVARIAAAKGEDATKKCVDIMETKDYLYTCISLALEDSEAYIMFRDNDVVIANTAVLASLMYHDYSACETNDISFEEFRQIVFESEVHLQFMPTESEANEYGFLCIYKDFSNNHLEYDMAVVFKMHEDVIRQTLNIDDQFQYDFAYIEDGGGQIIYQINYSEEPLSEEVISEREVKLNGQKYTLLQSQTKNGGLKVVMGVSNKTIEKGINTVNQIIWLYIAVSIICMLCFCIYWALRREVSMRQVMNSLKYDEKNGEKKGEKINEFGYIIRGINRLHDENAGYREKIDEIQKSISNSMLEKVLLRGVYSKQDMEEVNNALHWSMEFYCVVCVNTRRKPEEEVLDLFCRSDDFMKTHFSGISASVGRNERVYIIHMEVSDAPDTKEIGAVLGELADQYEDIWIGISSIGTGLENVRLCYRQARLVSRQISDKYDTRVSAYHESSDGSGKLFKLNMGNRIYDLILAEEVAAVEVSFEKIKSYARKNYWSSEQEVMRFFFEVQNPVARVWDELAQNQSLNREFPAYQADKGIMELIGELEEASLYLCDCIRKNKETSRSSFCSRMLEFVEENYMNKDMCVSYAAAYLGISDKYFITLYKEQTGKNFGAYVEARRLKQAEKYLLETDWSMGKIADAVGYSTIDAFYKSFKKNYGLAPGKWKESRK